MIFLSIADILYINRTIIHRYGGRFEEPNNLHNYDSLEWALYVIQNPIFFGANRYPTIGHKAAVLAWAINANHVFIDGNKRTSVVASSLFLSLNDCEFAATNQDMKDISIYIADKSNTGATIENIMNWYIERTRLLSE